MNRCGQLQAALAEQKEQTQSILSGWNNHHPAPHDLHPAPHNHLYIAQHPIFSNEGAARGGDGPAGVLGLLQSRPPEEAEQEVLGAGDQSHVDHEDDQLLIMRMINSRDYSKVDKLVLADSVIEQLLVDNDRLTDELGRLKENFKVTDI